MRLINKEQKEKKRSLLKDVEVVEVSSVGRGANQGALVTLLKTDEEREEIPPVNSQEENMELEKKIEELEASNKEMADKLAKSDLAASLNDLQKSHYAKLEGEDKDAFEKASAGERQQIVSDAIAKAEAEDETMEINGNEVRKSILGAEAFELLKTQKDENEKLQKAAEEAKAEAIQKQLEDDAEKEFPHLAGTPAAKAKVLKAAREDKEMMEVLKSADAHAESLTKEVGASSAGTADAEGKSAKEQLDDLAKAYAKENNVTKEMATVQILDTDQGKKLYLETLRD